MLKYVGQISSFYEHTNIPDIVKKKKNLTPEKLCANDVILNDNNNLRKKQQRCFYSIFYYSSFTFPLSGTIELRVDAVIHRQLMGVKPAWCPSCVSASVFTAQTKLRFRFISGPARHHRQSLHSFTPLFCFYHLNKTNTKKSIYTNMFSDLPVSSELILNTK